MTAGPAPLANPIPRWDSRPKHPASAPGEADFGTWHKEALSRDSYCMDVDKIEYRIDAGGNLRVVGIYELIRWGWHHDLDDIPERLAPYEGKLALLRRISASIAAGQGSSFPTFFVWQTHNWVRRLLELGVYILGPLIKVTEVPFGPGVAVRRFGISRTQTQALGGAD